MKLQNNKRISQLETLRFFAMLVIFASHCNFMAYYIYGDWWINNPIMGVDYFFMLSGFGLYYAYSDRSISKNGIMFAIEKIKTIYPLYILSMICMVPYSIIMDMKDSSFKTAILKAVIKLLGGGTLLQAGTGSSYTSHALNAPCWFLSCLFMIYMICPVLLRITKKMNAVKWHVVSALLAVLFLGLASIFTSSLESRSIYINELFYASPYVRWIYVYIGMQIAAIVKKAQIHFSTRVMSLAEAVCVICACGWFVCRNMIGSSNVILRLVDVVLCASCLLFFSVGRGAISLVLANDRYSFAGKLSSYVFIVHFVVISYVDLWFEKNRYLLGQWTGIVELFIIIGIIYFVIKSIRLLENGRNTGCVE